MRKIVLISLALVIAVSAVLPLAAHDLTDPSIMGVGDYLELRFWPDMITVDYWISVGSVEALNFRSSLDTNQDGIISKEEQEGFLVTLSKEVIAKKFTVEVDGQPLPFQLRYDFMKIDLCGERGLGPVMVKINYPSQIKIPGPLNQWHHVVLKARNILGKMVTAKILVATQPGTEVNPTPEEAQNIERWTRGEQLISEQEVQISTSYRVVNTMATSDKQLTNFFTQNTLVPETDKTTSDLLAFLKEKNLSLGIILAALVIAFVYGMGHALMPGHGKTLVAAYLVGSHGTVWDAIFLGLTVTLTHVSVVIIVGVITLVAAQWINNTILNSVLSAFSSLLLVLIGTWMLIRRIKALRQPVPAEVHNHDHFPEHEHAPNEPHEHPHDHSHHHDHSFDYPHDHPHEHTHALNLNGVNGSEHDHPHSHDSSGAHYHTHPTKITLRTLLPLGISGGMLPCPTAILILLMAVSINRIAWGLALILSFSLGLAGVLVVIGILMVTGNRFIQRFSPSLKIINALTVIGPIVIITIGIILIIQALIPLI